MIAGMIATTAMMTGATSGDAVLAIMGIGHRQECAASGFLIDQQVTSPRPPRVGVRDEMLTATAAELSTAAAELSGLPRPNLHVTFSRS